MKAKRLEESPLALGCERMLLQQSPPLAHQPHEQQQQQEKDFIVSAPAEDSSSSLTTTTTTTMQIDDELLKVASTDEQQRRGKIRASGADSSPCCSPRSHLKMKRVSSTRVVKAQDRRTPAYARSPITPPKKSSAARRLFDAPSAEELEEFFAASEDKMELRSFTDRYNFDVVHDVPLPGRYEWVKVQE